MQVEDSAVVDRGMQVVSDVMGAFALRDGFGGAMRVHNKEWLNDV